MTVGDVCSECKVGLTCASTGLVKCEACGDFLCRECAKKIGAICRKCSDAMGGID